jgi:DNA-binding NtrC family response regulator/tetratricopeptide (TPR) repeat protein
MTAHRPTLERVRHLVSTKQYRQALAQIDELECSDSSEVAEANVLKAEAMIGIGSYDASVLGPAISFLRTSPNTELLAHAKFLNAIILLSGGRLVDAQEELEEAYVYFKRHNNHLRMGYTAGKQSSVAFQCGDYSLASKYCNRALTHFAAAKAHAHTGLALLTMALIHLRAGELRRASEIIRQIDESNYASSWSERDLYNYYHIQMILGAQTFNDKMTRDALGLASKLTKDLRREYFRHLEISSYVHILAGEFADAERSLGEGEKLAFEIAPDSTLVSQIKRLFGDLYVATGKFDLAFKYASEGLAVAEKINERLEIAACQRIFAQVEVHRGHASKARDWFTKSIDLFNLISARYELAVTRCLAATSGLYQEGERTALLFLAKEYFESESVTPYIEKVTSELGKAQRTAMSRSARPIIRGKPVTIITVNTVMRKIIDMATHVAQSDMTVLLTGATGTGKDLLARYIHEQSGRTGEFVPVNTAAIPLTMIESELFGYRKGCFTGADRDRPGLIEQAHEGTLYLNELADAPLELQAKLLEVLEWRTVRRLGENNARPVDFRLIAATNQDMQRLMQDRLFRPDLFHRLNEIPIELPPLDVRKDDIPALTEHFLGSLGLDLSVNGNTEDLARLGTALAQRSWPGNVRQLQMVVRNLWAASSGDLDFMLRLVTELSDHTEEADELGAVLAEAGGNKSEAARRLGISESTLRYRLKRKDVC